MASNSGSTPDLDSQVNVEDLPITFKVSVYIAKCVFKCCEMSGASSGTNDHKDLLYDRKYTKKN